MGGVSLGELGFVLTAADQVSGVLTEIEENVLELAGSFIEWGQTALKSAMEAVESENLFEVSFGEMSKAARDWSDELSRTLGINAYELRKSSAMLYTMSSSMGLAKDKAFEMSTGLTKLAYDMASFYNLKPEEAFQKLRSGIVGETEPLRTLGILIDENTTKSVAYANGIAKAGATLTQQEKVQARYLAIMQQTTQAQGDLARTIDSPTNQLRVLSERFDQISIQVGNALIPSFQVVLTMLSNNIVPVLKDLADWVEKNTSTITDYSVRGLVVAADMFKYFTDVVTTGLMVLGMLWELFIRLSFAVLDYANNMVAAAKATAQFAAGDVLGAYQTIRKSIEDSGVAQKVLGAEIEKNDARVRKVLDAGVKVKEVFSQMADAAKKALNAPAVTSGAGVGAGLGGGVGSASAVPDVKALAKAHKELEEQIKHDEMTMKGFDAALEYDRKQQIQATYDAQDYANMKHKLSEAEEKAALTQLKSKYALQELNNVIPESTGLWTRYADVVDQELENANKDIEEHAATFGETISSALADLPNIIMGALQGGGDLGKSLGSALGGAIFGKDSKLVKDMTGGLTKALGDSIGGALGSMLPGLGSLLGSLGGKLLGKVGSFFGGLFGHGEISKVNDMRDAFFQAQGGFEQFSKKMSAVSKEDWAKKIFNAKTVDEFNKLVKEAQGLLDTQGQAQEDLNAAIEKYGFTVDQLGPKMRQQKLDEQAAQLLKDFKLLTASGIDVGVVTEKMSSDINAYVQNALKSGAAIPEAMRPMLEAMVKAGTLTDAAGNKIKDLSGITFSQTLTEGLQSAVDAINRLVEALTGVQQAGAKGINVNVNTGGGSSGDGRKPPPHMGSYASGFSGVVPGVGPSTMTVHGGEHVEVTPVGQRIMQNAHLDMPVNIQISLSGVTSSKEIIDIVTEGVNRGVGNIRKALSDAGLGRTG